MSHGEYTTAQVAELAGLTPGRVRRFVALGLLEPSKGPRGEHLFGFSDVALLRAWAKLPGSTPAKIRRALEAVRCSADDGASLDAQGSAIVAVDNRGAFEPGTGQQLLELEPSAEAAVASLRTQTYRTEPEALINEGRIRHESGNPAGAATLYEKALGSASQDIAAIAWFNLGVAREDLGDREGALQAYREAIASDPKSRVIADAHYNAARLCERQGDQLGAMRHLRAYGEHAGAPV